MERYLSVLMRPISWAQEEVTIPNGYMRRIVKEHRTRILDYQLFMLRESENLEGSLKHRSNRESRQVFITIGRTFLVGNSDRRRLKKLKTSNLKSGFVQCRQILFHPALILTRIVHKYSRGQHYEESKRSRVGTNGQALRTLSLNSEMWMRHDAILWRHYCRQRCGRVRQDIYIGKKRLVDKFVSCLFKQGKQDKAIITHGHASFASTGRWEKAAPVQRIKQECQKRYQTADVDEFCTSRCCRRCGGVSSDVQRRQENCQNFYSAPRARTSGNERLSWGETQCSLCQGTVSLREGVSRKDNEKTAPPDAQTLLLLHWHTLQSCSSCESEAASSTSKSPESKQTEPEEDREEDDDVDVPECRVHRALGDERVARSLLVGRARSLELVENDEVDSELERARVLRPTDPHGDELDLDEEASEQDLRHEDGRKRFGGDLDVGCNAPGKESRRGGGDADQPNDEHVEDEVSLERLRPEAERQLREELRPEVGNRPVRACRILPHKARSLRGEGEDHGLSCAEHGADGEEDEGTEVRLDVIAVADLVEDEREDEVETDRRPEPRHQRPLVPQHRLHLSLPQSHELSGPARLLPLELPRQLSTFHVTRHVRIEHVASCRVGHAEVLENRLIQRLHEEHNVVGGVCLLGDRITDLAEVIAHLVDSSVVKGPSLRQQDRPIKEVEDLRGGLMDRTQHRTSQASQVLQRLNHVVCCKGVEPRSGLVEEEDRGRSDQFHPDACTPATIC
eukprot:348285-Hanusia_phi.AAC.2